MNLNVQMATVTDYTTGDFLGLKNVQILQVKIEDDNDATPVLLINPDGDESAPQNDERVPVVSIGNFRFALGGLDGVEPATSQGEKRIYSKNADGKVIAKIYLDKDGNITIENDDGDGNLVASITTDKDGNITAQNAKGSAAIDKDGATTIQNDNGSVSLDKDGNIKGETTSGNITAKTTSGDLTLSTTSGSLTLAAIGASLWQPNILPSCLFTGAPHGGTSGGITGLKGGTPS